VSRKRERIIMLNYRDRVHLMFSPAEARAVAEILVRAAENPDLLAREFGHANCAAFTVVINPSRFVQGDEDT
jgi:hypothetical protein